MRYDFVEAFTGIDDELVTDVFPEAQRPVEIRPERRSPRFRWKALAAAAACLAVVGIAVGAVFAVKSRGDRTADPDQTVSGADPVSAGYPKDAKYKYEGDFSELKLGMCGMTDRMVYGTFDSLAQTADLIVVGTFVDDARQSIPLTGGVRNSSMEHSYNKLRIDTVYKGDAEVGSEIVISDTYYVHDGHLCYVYGLSSTPMIKGEQWVYFLTKVFDENGSHYYSLGGYDGRFTVPGNENTFILCDPRNEFDVMMNVGVYPDVQKMLDGDPDTLARISVEYEGIKYNVVGYRDIDGVKLTVGTTRSVYEAGDYVEVLAVVENTTDNPIGLAMNIGSGGHDEVPTYLKNGDYILTDLNIGLTTMGSERYVIKPGEVYYQPMRFSTYENCYRPEDTVIADYVPLGTYNGHSGIRLVTDPEPEYSHNYKPYGLDYTIEVVNSRTEYEFTMDEFPGVKFKCDGQNLTVNDSDTVLYTGWPINDLYLIDLNGDGKRELCSTVYIGSGIIDERVMAYDYANGKLYELADRGRYDYRISAYAGELSGDYYVDIEKYEYSTNKWMWRQPFKIGLLTEVKSQSTDIRQAYEGVTEVKIASEMSLDDFPGEKFVFGEKSIDVILKDGSEDNLFGMSNVTPIEHIYLFDMNGDGKREIIVEHFSQPGEQYVPVKVITIIDHANDGYSDLYTYEKFTLTVKGDQLYPVLNGEVQSEPLTLESFKELNRSLGI
ncbi:MAG: hypothetical protein K2N56_01320 [Oscillospiraceae bacterium]|nr:hypothetical protein [Oscillospiraceae bacterium]